MRVTMHRVVRTFADEQIDDKDLISIKDAASLSGIPISTISRLMSGFKLPEYRPVPRFDIETQRFTSRRAVLALKKPEKDENWPASPKDTA